MNRTNHPVKFNVHDDALMFEMYGCGMTLRQICQIFSCPLKTVHIHLEKYKRRNISDK